MISPHIQTLFREAYSIVDEVLWNVFKKNEMGDILLPFVVLRRLDCMLEPKKKDVLDTYDKYHNKLSEDRLKPLLLKASGKNFYNTSQFNFINLKDDESQIALNFKNYRDNFSSNVRDILENFQFETIVNRLIKNKKLYEVIKHIAQIDLSIDRVDNHDMGYLFEEMIRISNEQSNETAGEHFTPRDIVNLMTKIVLSVDKEELNEDGLIRSIYDPCCGTGGLLTFSKSHIKEHINPRVNIQLYGQEANEQSYAIAKSDLLITGENASNIKHGNTLTEDQFPGETFHYMLANPPYGVNWKGIKPLVEIESNIPGSRFEVGLPRTSDGQLLFLLHMLHKMDSKGSRIGVVTNGSPLFTGDAGSGESEIRRHLIENDYVEAIIGLPNDLFFNTGISTYIWFLTNKKSEERLGKIQLIDASQLYVNEKKSLNNKRKKIDDNNQDKIFQLYSEFQETECCKIYPNEFFGYLSIPVEQPLKDETGKIVFDKKGHPKPNTKLRDVERVALTEDPEKYFSNEVQPHLPESWMDFDRAKIGYEINFTKYFYQYKPLRSSVDITSDLLELEKESEKLLNQIVN